MARQLRTGTWVLLLLGGGLGGWAVATDISSAVLASGSLVVESNVKRVQHPTGGVVAEIRVRDGDVVNAGDLLIRLDQTVTRANLAILHKTLNEQLARKARLEAERDGTEAITYPSELLAQKSDPNAEHAMAAEAKVLELRHGAREGQKGLLRERAAQLSQEISGNQAQEKGKAKELLLIQRELKGAQELRAKDLMTVPKLSALEREAARLEGERAQLFAAIAQGKGKVAEVQLQILQVDRNAASEIANELRECEAKIGELVERKSAAEDQLRRIDIRAPQGGTVHQSVVHTVGGVITTSETLMLIVPEGDSLAVELKVSPHDIDQLWIGQSALLRFSAFNRHATPEISGKVAYIAADIESDPRTSAKYYNVRVSLEAEELARLGQVKLVPGMPVDAMIKTADRRVISYLIKPLRDQLGRAFREN
jgi:HlyD family secretion protein